MKPKTKFKVGDKVKILPSATRVWVMIEEVGKIGIISRIDEENNCFSVTMLNSCKGRVHHWSLSNHHITPVIKVGQQLLFDFAYPLE